MPTQDFRNTLRVIFTDAKCSYLMERFLNALKKDNLFYNRDGLTKLMFATITDNAVKTGSSQVIDSIVQKSLETIENEFNNAIEIYECFCEIATYCIWDNPEEYGFVIQDCNDFFEVFYYGV